MEPVVDNDITWVGLDAHKKTIAVAVLGAGREQVEEWTAEHTAAGLAKLVRRLAKLGKGTEIRACYEAGPCGFALQRTLEASGKLVCEVIAPSLIPKKPGERIKTDRRDARKLAELLRAGLLTTVRPPSPEQEAMRDVCRCREDAREDVGRARHRLQKMLVRHGLSFTKTSKLWSAAYRRWLSTVRFDHKHTQAVFDDYLAAVHQAEGRLKGLDSQLEQAAEEPLYRESVARLRCFRGVDTITAMVFVCELYDFGRFDSPRQLSAYLGLTPSVHASGESARRGGITKAGNRHVRRILVQSAWTYRHRPAVGPKLRARRERQAPAVIALADRAQQRLHRRYRRLSERGKAANKVVIAVTRELVGFLWAALQDDARARLSRAT